jgi:broad specificity phosphatase PhoE
MAASLERKHDRRAAQQLIVRVGGEMQEGPPGRRIALDAARPAPGHSLPPSLFPRVVNELLLARHGETEWSLNGRHTGRTDLPLTENGRQLALRLAPRLEGQTFALVLTSPLRRAIETCELAGLGARAQIRDDLREWDYGDYEGLTTAEIRRRRPGWSLWSDGCPNGEVAAEVGARADRVIAEARAADAGSIAFGHGHMLRALAARWLGLEPERGALFALATGTLSTLGYERDTAVIRSWSELPR